MKTSRVAVLGGGLQGACTAIELASRSIKVDLYEKCPECLSAASSNNEGKIHLGYVYGNDLSLKSARTMIAGALTFAPLMRRWIGDAMGTVPVSSPFRYLVHARSLRDADMCGRFYDAVHALHLDAARQGHGDYFGIDLNQRPRRVPKTARGMFDSAEVAAVFETDEIAIDPEALARIVRARLASDENIRLFTGTNVTGIGKSEERFAVDFDNAHGTRREPYDHVVNALWAGRLKVDAMLGLLPDRPWLFRVKRCLRVMAMRNADAIPSVTIVLGPFGDSVNYRNGDVFLAWYPAGLAGMHGGLEVPDWPPGPEGVADLKERTLAGLMPFLPALAALSPAEIDAAEVRGGAIFAMGETDIDDAGSELHERHQVGVISRGNYHSINTGKLTLAPMFAKQVADKIRAVM
jgi:glycine/D-amino acid oxidase-like deaminating enzyme